MLKKLIFILLVTLTIPKTGLCSIFGEENLALAKLVVGQIVELERLASALEIAKDQQELLSRVNEGISRAITQIEAIEEILERAKGLDPKNVRRLSELTMLIEDVKDLKRRAQEVVQLKILITNQAIAQSAVQSETAYTMGQEMIKSGSSLTRESESASPGRAAQIAAAAQSAQMLSSGVALQTLSHIAQLTAVSLDLQKTQIEEKLVGSQAQSDYFRTQLLEKAR